MVDPLSLTIGGIALTELAEGLAKKQLGEIFGSGLKKLTKSGKKNPYHDAMVQAFEGFGNVFFANIRSLGFADDELEPWGPGLKALIEDPTVADELWRPLIDGEATAAPDVDVLRETWLRLDGEDLPEGFRWESVAAAYRRQVENQRIVDDTLRPMLQVDVLRQLRNEARGAQPKGDLARYAARMRTKYKVLDLSHFVSPTVDEPRRGLLLREAFVPQQVRDDPPPVEVPRDLLGRMIRDGEWHGDGLDREERDEVAAARLERLQTSYLKRPAGPVLDVVAQPGSRKLVIIGDPGTGKSTLTRYLLLRALEEHGDAAKPLGGHLPLLIELRDFFAERAAGHCDDFLAYCHFLGKDQGYFLDQTWLHRRLEAEPSLVLFDGLDEIFDPIQRDKVAEAIVGFGHRYPSARVVVTSRPVGYRPRVLRDAGFRHVALDDLDDERIETFVRGWFGRLFDDPKAAEQRIERVLGAARRSSSIRLLAGNPMLLTIMCLIAQLRELPRDRARFYEHAADVLCHHWDANRGLEAAGIPSGYIDLDDKRELLRGIAFRMQAAEGGLAGNFIHEDELKEDITGYLERRYSKPPAEAKVATKALIHQLRERNYVLCLRGPRLYGFVHRTFLEYFCAAELVRRLQFDKTLTIEQLREDYFAEHWRDEAWAEPLRLICGMVSDRDAEVLIRYLATEADPGWRNKLQVQPPRHLELAVLCLAERRELAAVGTAARAVAEGVEAFFELPSFGYPHPGLPWETRRWASDRFGAALAELPRGWAGPWARQKTALDRPSIAGHPDLRDAYAKALAGAFSDEAQARPTLIERSGHRHFLVRIAA